MKWIFFTLVLLNGFYFTWNWYLTQSAKEAAQQAQSETTTPKVIVQNPTAVNPNLLIKKCMVFGSVDELEVAQKVQRQLYANGFSSELHKKKEKTKVQHTVYIAPAESYEAAWKRSKNLQTQGIDSSIIRSGSLENAISLGVYTKLENAKRVYKQYKHLGDVKIQRETWENTLYWVKLNTEDTQKLEQMKFLGGSDIFQGIKKQKKNCDAKLD